jgi:TolA-binding protein
LHEDEERRDGDAIRDEAFVSGWAALETDPAGAEHAFAKALALDPAGEMAEESRYGLCLALYRSGSARSRGALESYLFEYPDGPHAAEVAALLGANLLEAGDDRGAEQRFHQALDSPSADVRAAAREGLRRIDGQERRETR